MRAAFYECEITPPIGGFMWGHYKNVVAQNVKDRLYAKAVVMEDGGEYAAIVAVDTCSLTPGIQTIIAKRVAEFTPIPENRVCISSNHSHSGAPISSDPSCGGVRDEAYYDVFLRLCADAIILAYRRLEEADVTYGYSKVDTISFNRNFRKKDGTYVTHGRWRPDWEELKPLSGIDPDLPVLFFEADGKPIGAIVNFACHQCCLTKYAKTGYSGDFSSYLSKHLKEKYGQDFVSVFLLGACGDINHVNPNPNVPIPEDHYQYMGKVLADAVIASLEKGEKVEGSLKMAMATEVVPRRPYDNETVTGIMKKMIKRNASSLRIRNLLHYASTGGGATEDVLPVQAILVGDVLISVLPGEIYHAFGKYIKENSPVKKNMVVENSNEYCGYIPTEEVFDKEKDDLYETSLCGHSRYVPEAGKLLCDKVLSIAKELK